MTRFTPTRTPHTGDENPGGMIRQGQGFGLDDFAIFPTGDARLGNVKSQQPARPMGEAGRNVGKMVNIKVGGPFSPSHTFGSVIGKSILRGATVRTGRGAWRRVTPQFLWRLAK